MLAALVLVHFLRGGAALAGPARPTEDRWVASGPFVPRVDAVVESPADPDTLFAIANTHLFRSSDGGRTWSRSPLGQGTDDEAIAAVAIDATRPRSVLAGEGFGMFLSSDDGVSWSGPMSVPKGHASSVLDFAVAPSSPRTLYVACGADAYRSDDAGETYSVMKGPWSSDFAVTAVGVDPVSSEVVYAAVEGLGVFKSPDGGGHWIRGGPGLDDGVMRLLVHPIEPRFVYAVTRGEKLFESSDGGIVWRSIGPVGAAVRCVAIAPDDPSVILAGGDGLLRTSDHGASWSLTPIAAAVSGRTIRVQTLSVGPASGRLYAGTVADGLFVSDDGVAWSPRSDGLAGAFVEEFAGDAESGELYASVVVDGPRLFRREPGRRAWVEIDLSPLSAGASQLRIARGEPNSGVVYAGVLECGGGDPQSPTPCFGGLYRTADFGASWTKVLDGAISAVAIEPEDHGVLYASVVDDAYPGGGRLWKSQNAGFSWFRVATPMEDFPPTALYPDPLRAGHLVATYGTGLFVTLDGGGSWSEAAELRSEEVLFVLPAGAGSRAFAGTYDGLYSSDDGGTTWVLTDDELGASAMARDPSDPNRVWSGSSSGIARSTDEGRSWVVLDRGVYSLGLFTAAVRTLFVDAARRRLFVATESGLFEHALAPLPRIVPGR